MRIVLAITGASGAIYADQLIGSFQHAGIAEVQIIASQNARRIFLEERQKDLIETSPYPVQSPDNFDVPYVSGSNSFSAMVIAPCSMGTLGRIAHGSSESAITRTADVMLKEKKTLILVPRETPLSLIHIENLRHLSLAGATLIPAMPSFYSLPQTVEEVAQTVTGRILDHLNIPHQLRPRWQENKNV